MTGLSKSTIWKMHKEGKFPQRKNIGPRAVGGCASGATPAS
jgi:predicted DNA-binding transcriptional regulator AlpA